MHMADALVSPAVGGTMWAVSAGLLGYSCKRVKRDFDDQKVPLMGVVGAFAFAAQMINFAIPGTGSSGHLGGGLLLAALLGPHAGFLTLSSVLVVQALFFADGGLLALGCNIFNLGVLPCLIAYPLIFRPLSRGLLQRRRILIASLLAAVVGLQLGALSVVLETRLSGIAELPFLAFAALMQPIHLAIGVVEGLATAAVLIFIASARPEVLNSAASRSGFSAVPMKSVIVGLVAAALLVGGALSWFASSRPDGLEWAMENSASDHPIEAAGAVHDTLAGVQTRTALLPEYGFAESEPKSTETEDASWPAVSAGTTTAGIVGGLFSLLAAAAIGFALRKRKRLDA